jgi:hypothetical protein
MELHDAGAAVGAAVEPDGLRAAPHAPNRGGASREGRMVCTRKHCCSDVPSCRDSGGVGRVCGPGARRGLGDRAMFRAWTRERVGPFLLARLGRCSDLLSLLGVQLDAIEHGGKAVSVSTVACAGSRAKGPIGAAIAQPKVTPARRFRSHNRPASGPLLQECASPA